jgi:transcriptional regulator with XRE-family HTH domain
MEDEPLSLVLKRNALALKAKREISELALARRAGVGSGSVNRVMNGQNVQLDVLAGMSRGLGVPAWMLLVPDFDPDDPPVVSTKAQIEALIVAAIEQRWEAIKSQMEALRVREEKDRPSVADPFPVGAPASIKQHSPAASGPGTKSKR